MSEEITKLSQAIRIGAKLRPQCQGAFFKDGFSCVLGAALEACGIKPSHFIAAPFNYLSRRFGVSSDELLELVIKNDNGMTREQIADELEARGL